ncbi:ssDNA endonuclease and repair protein rad10 [Malassezia equina]|uniref:SsDNA endonuclease and repair protein rad10 n=1 Tax=Malassezia equina TaxID=1381935 RepID=A0AAF0EB07_9BASI|nr:ssDNA endonuclease and repair protein rad10 [Malassezia equina]
MAPADTEGDRGSSAGTAGRPHPLVRGAQSSSSILVNSCQRGNPVLQHIKGVAWEYADIVPDYQVGLSSGVLFLSLTPSLRYHRLHPEYIHMRIQKLAHMYTLRVLMVVCDVNDHQPAIRELTKIALINRMVMLVAWSAEEAGRYLEMYKVFEQKPPDVIRGKTKQDYMSVMQAVLTNIRGVNKTDVWTLSTNFSSLADLAMQPPEKFLMLPGMGDIKAKNLARAFREPFQAEKTMPRNRPKAPTAAAPVHDKETLVEPRDNAAHETAPATDDTMNALPANVDTLSEEEQLRIALQLSMDGQV